MGSGIRRDKFVELAEKRVARAIKDLRLIGNLSNRTNYSYDQRDVQQIISVLQAEIKLLKQRFETSGVSEDVIFKLHRNSPEGTEWESD
jgi:hypothetical protein